MTTILMSCRNLKDLSRHFKLFMQILLNPYDNNSLKSALNDIFKGKRSTDYEELHEETLEDVEEEDERVRGKYTESPYYLHFVKIYLEVSEDVKKSQCVDSNDNNSLYSEHFALYILKQCMAFAPLWTDILYDLSDEIRGRYSNANVECWFKEIKKSVLKNATYLKVGRFIEAVRERIEADLKAIELNIGPTPKKNRSKRFKENRGKKMAKEINRPLSEEVWKPKRKSSKYFSLLNLERKVGDIKQKHISEESGENSSKNSHELIDTSDSSTSENDKKSYSSNADAITITSVETTAENSNDLGHSSITSDDSEFTDNRALENGLFFNRHYYLSCSSMSFVVGIYKYDENTIRLHSRDYILLTSIYNSDISLDKTVENRWITDHCLDCVSFIFLKSCSNIYYIDTTSCQILFSDNVHVKFKPYVKPLDDIKFIIIPLFVNNNHWTLVILDLETQSIYHLDPGHSGVTESFVFQKIKKFFTTRDRIHKTDKLNIRKWKMIQLHGYPKQNDSINCGIYVLYYILVLSKTNKIESLTETTFTENFDPETFRMSLQSILLLCSENMSDTCLVCGSNENADYVKCSSCKRWVHFNPCVKFVSDENKHFTFEDMKNKNFIFNCHLCKLYGQNPFLSVEDKTEVILADLELDYFVSHYKNYLLQVHSERETNEESRRFREIPDYFKHLKWDYSTAFISFDSSAKICKIIRERLQIFDNEFISFVLLGCINKKIFYKYYGLPEDGNINMFEKYRILYDDNDCIYPSPYTLDLVLSELSRDIN